MSSKSVVKRIFEDAWNVGNLEVFDELLHPDHVFVLPGSGNEIVGLNGFKEFASVYKGAFGQSYEILKLVGDEQFVTAAYIERGKFENDYVTETGQGVIHPTGLPYETGGVELYELVEGKIIRTWAGHESLLQYLQLGLAVIRDTRW